ncbi:MAG: hypothetical protein J5U19_14855 [Candidatus Methanoperedens sp.]|nr:hypothetical protein [Candidatus Methanoperedens sp.]
MLLPSDHFYSFRSRSHTPHVSSYQLQESKATQESISKPARPELQGVIAARVLRLAGAARHLLTAGAARSVLRKMGSHCHLSMIFTDRQKVLPLLIEPANKIFIRIP